MAWIGYLAGAAATYMAGKQGADANKNAGAAANDLYGAQADLLKKLSPYAIDYYKKSQQAYAPAFNYYSSVASGDRQAVMGALSPELNAIGGKYRSMIDATRTLQPRGGASASYNADLAWRSADEQQGLINQRRAEAIANLVKMAGLAGDLGAGAAGTATNAGQGASGILGDIMRSNSSAAAQQAAAYGEVGKALAQMFNDPSFQGMFKSGG